MSYLAEVSANLDNEVYDYHLPHTKTIDLVTIHKHFTSVTYGRSRIS